MSRLLAPAAIVVAFMGKAAAESPHDRRAPSEALNFKGDCSAVPNGTCRIRQFERSIVSIKRRHLSALRGRSENGRPPQKGGAMPVIPPPGTPGGHPNTVPK